MRALLRLVPGLVPLWAGRWLEAVGWFGVSLLLVGAAVRGWARMNAVGVDPRLPAMGPAVVAALLLCAASWWSASRGTSPRLPIQAQVGLVGLGWWTAVAWLAPLLIRVDGVDVLLPRHALPSTEYWMGTSDRADLWTRWALSARTAWWVAVPAALGTMAVGLGAGLLAGWRGGVIDRLIGLVADTLLSLPSLLLQVVAVGLFTPHGGAQLAQMVAILVLTGWPRVARVVRGQVRELSARPFIDAARVAGMTDAAVLRWHLLPNLVLVLQVLAAMQLVRAVVAEASLSLLNLGATTPSDSWGRMIGDLKAMIAVHPWELAWPALAIVGVSVSAHLLADGLRDMALNGERTVVDD